MEYGCWLTKFVEGPDDSLEAWEYNADASEFVQGVTLATSYWRDQHEVCGEIDAPFVPPYAHDLAAVSTGVFEGEPIEG